MRRCNDCDEVFDETDRDTEWQILRADSLGEFVRCEACGERIWEHAALHRDPVPAAEAETRRAASFRQRWEHR